MKYSIPVSFRFWPFTVVAAILCGSSLSVSAATYFVNSNATYGNDTHTGTSPTTAWKTLYEVMQHTFSPGDIIAFRRGQSWSGELGQSSPSCVLEFNGSGTGSDSVHVIRATCYDSDSGTGGIIGDGGTGALPIFYGIAGPNQNGRYTVLLQNQQYWTLEDLDIRGGQYAALAVQSNTTGYVARGITLRNLTVRDTDYYHYGTSPTDFWWLGNGILIYNAGATQAKFDSLVLDHCTIFNCWARGISQENNVGPLTSTDQSYLNTGVAMTYNDIHDTRQDCTWLSGDYDFLFDHNTLDRAGQFQNTESPQPRYDYGAVFWNACLGSSTTGCRAQYNTVSNTAKRPNTDTNGFFTDNAAFDLDIGNYGLHLIQYNLSHDNAGGFMEILPTSMNDAISGVTDRLIVRFNISYHDDLNALDGVPDLSTPHTPAKFGRDYCPLIKPLGRHQEFYRNTFYCGTGLAIVNRVTWGGEPPLEDGIFTDNIFYATATGKFYGCKDGGILNPMHPNATNTLTYDHNCFLGDTTDLVLNTNATDGDPLFLTSGDPTTPTDLMLKSNSPCLKRGTNTGIPNPVPQVDDFAYPYDLGLTPGADQYENVMFFGGEGNTSDVSGHGNTGTLGGSGTTFPGSGQQHSGNFCFSFTGAGWMTVPAASTDLITNELAVDIWIYPTNSVGYRRLVNKMTSGSNDGFFLDLSPTNQIRWHVRGTEILTTATVTENVWTHIEAVYTQSGPMAVYVNGSVLGSTTAPNLPAISNTALLFLVAADNNTGSRFVGKIDNVEIRHDSVVR